VTTRSTNLWAVNLVGRPSGVVYTVPPGFVVLLKSVYAQNSGSNPATVQLYLTSQLEAIALAVAKLELAAGASAGWEGWIALNAHDTVTLVYDTGPILSWGSGALLPVP